MILNISKIVFYHYTLFSVDQRRFYCKVGLLWDLNSFCSLFVLLYNNILYRSIVYGSFGPFLFDDIDCVLFRDYVCYSRCKIRELDARLFDRPAQEKSCLFDANKSAKRRDGRLPCLKAIVSNAPLLRSIKDTDAWTDAPLCLCLANSTLDFLFIFFFNLFFHSSNYFVTK